MRVRPGTGGGRVLDLSVDGVDITVTAVDRPASGTVTVDGFTVPRPADSLADAALALATGTDPELRGRDLLDLLWALHRTPADGPRTATPVLAREDAYRSARPAGAAGSLAVRLSELLDSAAQDPDALTRHEETWRALGVTDAGLPALRAELTALADGLRVLPEVTADPVRALAARLPACPPPTVTRSWRRCRPRTVSGWPPTPCSWTPCAPGATRPSSPRSPRAS
ncbi:hypothetical protein GCM10023238_14700 [Streptomyces heliomycini]